MVTDDWNGTIYENEFEGWPSDLLLYCEYRQRSFTLNVQTTNNIRIHFVVSHFSYWEVKLLFFKSVNNCWWTSEVKLFLTFTTNSIVEMRATVFCCTRQGKWDFKTISKCTAQLREYPSVFLCDVNLFRGLILYIQSTRLTKNNP